ncbi:unnamed protein product [Allacma fusca]|uniref:Uncharacterized protein n=1 Tax=Allacma fusca TaxID=39272 RepID=A0A8J2J0R1_9HEXA|nr:unnamed protein product [Allacma fusca]
MDFKILEKVLESLCLPVNYLDKFQAESIDDNIRNLACKDEELKEELRSIVPITGHRIAILNAFKAAFKADKNVKTVLLQHDKEMRVSYGADVIKTDESLKPLPPKLRRHLVKIMCQHLIKKNSFSNESYFSPSTTVLDPQTGKKKSTSPTGHIQYHLKNFWSSIRLSNGSLKLECNADPIVEQSCETAEPNSEAMDMKNWLMNHAAPPQKVFEFLLKTFTIRRNEMLKCKRESEYTSFCLEWPRMLDTPGAIEHDFSLSSGGR